ncbi:MAG: hypothetical protein ACREF8_03920 [Chthoniobacterales bacterium]
MKSASLSIAAVAFILAAAGFLLPLWPLCVLGIFVAALSGRFVFALAIGLLLDIAYGAPAGAWHMLYFPFTLLAVLFVLLRYIGMRYVRSRGSDTL